LCNLAKEWGGDSQNAGAGGTSRGETGVIAHTKKVVYLMHPQGSGTRNREGGGKKETKVRVRTWWKGKKSYQREEESLPPSGGDKKKLQLF